MLSVVLFDSIAANPIPQVFSAQVTSNTTGTSHSVPHGVTTIQEYYDFDHNRLRKDSSTDFGTFVHFAPKNELIPKFDRGGSIEGVCPRCLALWLVACLEERHAVVLTAVVIQTHQAC